MGTPNLYNLSSYKNRLQRNMKTKVSSLGKWWTSSYVCSNAPSKIIEVLVGSNNTHRIMFKTKRWGEGREFILGIYSKIQGWWTSRSRKKASNLCGCFLVLEHDQGEWDVPWCYKAVWSQFLD